RLGIEVYKVGMVWPLAHDSALDFVRGKQEVLVIEEKRGIIESQFKEYFYDYPGRKPERMVGKEDELGHPLVPWTGELSPLQLAGIVARRLDHTGITDNLTARADALLAEEPTIIDIAGAERKPYFCSGCPHNTSTKVPDGSIALAGIGCHFMASWMDRETEGLIQMGGEGVNWITRSMFNGGRHVFQNLGDGTYYHSGSLAIRQALAAGTNITFKILFNDAVAMTGGQPVDGPLSVQRVAHAVRAEGVERIAIVSDEPDLFSLGDFPSGTTISHRREMDALQRELREIPGVTVLIYSQTCATELRRRRKRGLIEDPKRFAVINDLVCEGCGDCSVESNCLSVVPKETPFGRKRQIDQNSCNKDFSCLNGFCPSFVTVEGGERRRPDSKAMDIVSRQRIESLPQPDFADIGESFDLLVTGVGGTGVVTVGALITMAAHLEGKGASVLDFMGFAQKFGPVLSYIRIADTPGALNQVRIDDGQADALIGCDLVVSSSPKASRTYRQGQTKAVLNTTEMSTADFVIDPDADMKARRRVRDIGRAVGTDNLSTLAANALAESWLGDTIYANVILLGYAWQKGLVPVSVAALERAIELNGVRIDENRQAFRLGRLAAVDADAVKSAPTPAEESLDAQVERRAEFLTRYQNAALAERYRSRVEQVRNAERALTVSPDRRDVGAASPPRSAPADDPGLPLTTAVARAFFKTLAYKDEYEVARLYAETPFLDEVRRDFGQAARIRFHLAPPILSTGRDARGRPLKKEFGAWMLPVFKLLSKLRGLRGTPFDVFGYTAERRMERELIVEFERTLDRLLEDLTAGRIDEATDIVSMYLKIRGFGPVKEANAERLRERIAVAVERYGRVSRKAARGAGRLSVVSF
ncbi:MAG: indolepyruvate ferredoxin oxidoreductase family protein, partial [Woeseiaceae bacterium]|nr:indolepyruvate ferredoxin oxidoreductase family protein [Woeseiaceae bacterium]